MFGWCIFLFSVLLYAWLVRGAPATRTERLAFAIAGGLFLGLALLALFGVGPVMVVRHG